MLRNRKVLLFISLLIAVGLWVYVMGNVDPDTTEKVAGIKVSMSGTESLENAGLNAVLNKPKIITVTLEGKRSQINKAKKKGIEAYVDVSTCDYGRNEKEIYVRLPEGITGVAVEDMSSEKAVFTVK